MSELNNNKKPAKRSKAKFFYLGAIVVIASVTGSAVYGKKILEQEILKQLEQRGAKAESVEVDYLGRLHLRDVTLPLKDGYNIHLDSVDGRPKILFIDGYIDANNIVADLGAIKVTAPQILIQNANLDPSTLRSVFGGSKNKPTTERIEQLSAGRIAIPEMNFELDTNVVSQFISYKNLELNNLHNGIVQNISVSGANVSSQTIAPTASTEIINTVKATFGEMNIEKLNLAFLARLASEKPSNKNSTPQLVHGPITIKNGTVESELAGVSQADFSFEEISSNGVTAHLLETPIVELANELKKVHDVQNLTPTEQVALAKKLILLSDIVDSGDYKIKGVTLENLPNTNIDNINMNEIGFKLADRKLDVHIDKLSAQKGDNEKIELGAFEINEFSWQPTLQAFEGLASLNSDQEIKDFPFYTLLPDFGWWRWKDLNIDIAAPVTDKNKADTTNSNDSNIALFQKKSDEERIKFKLKEYELRASKPVNGIPSSFRTAMTGLTIKIPENINETVYQQIHNLGYDIVTISSTTDIEWDQDNQTLIVHDISFNGDDMGRFSMSGLIGGFKKDFFSANKVLAQVALLGLTARELNLNLTDSGFINRVVEIQAKDQNMAPAALRSLIASTVKNSLQISFGDQPKMQPVITAFANFLNKPSNFSVEVKSKSEKGLGLFDFMAAYQDPTTLIEKVDITVKTD